MIAAIRMKNAMLSVVAPVFNESQGIEQVIRRWTEVLSTLDMPSEIVVANDGSTDGTQEILQKLADELPLFHFVSYSPNRGYGYALKQAIRASRGDFVVTLDSDGQFDLKDCVQLLKVQEENDFDLVTGYRVKKNDSFLRIVADRTLNLIVRSLFHIPLRDTNCALKLIRGNLARELNIEARGYPTPTEITVKLFATGARISEQPVSHLERTAGESKLRFFRTSVSMLRFLFYLRKKIALFHSGVLQSL
jgi:glycosyltransferase involved in cell wall biosynthesis